MADKIRIAAFVSGSGSNMQSIMDRCAEGYIPGEVVLVVSNKKDAYGLVRAEMAGIDRHVFIRKNFPDSDSAGSHLLEILKEHRVDLIALSGYLRKLPPVTIRAYRNRIVNIHPALLPKYGGKGMYGLRVHTAVLEAGETESGATIHYADDIYDHGEIIEQDKIPVYPEDTPETLAARVLKVEHQLYPRVIKNLAEKILKERKQ
jgi:phosphoribosylglycinamide formyltransferase-1